MGGTGAKAVSCGRSCETTCVEHIGAACLTEMSQLMLLCVAARASILEFKG